MHDLLERDFALWGDTQANRIACDALKAATIFFLLKAGRSPTQDKREVLQSFFDFVPDFPQRRETAEKIWNMYEVGEKSGGPAHQEACRKFVAELAGLVRPA